MLLQPPTYSVYESITVDLILNLASPHLEQAERGWISSADTEKDIAMKQNTIVNASTSATNLFVFIIENHPLSFRTHLSFQLINKGRVQGELCIR